MEFGTDTGLLLTFDVETLLINTMNMQTYVYSMSCKVRPFFSEMLLFDFVGSECPFDGDAVSVCERLFHAMNFRCLGSWIFLLVNETHKNYITTVRAAEAATAWT